MVPQGTTANDQLGFDFESNDLNARAFENGKLTADRYLDLHTVTLAKGESVGYLINTFAPISALISNSTLRSLSTPVLH